MDFIVELPQSKEGHNAILVCVDRLTKMAHFCPTTTEVTAEGTAKLFLQHVFRNHGLPEDIVTDRGTQFTSRFTSELLRICGIRSNKSTAFHPQSDGQTERVNQILEQYLRTFCNYQQDDWLELLPLAEFAYNNAKHTSTQTSPFFANNGRHPRTTTTSTRGSDNPAAEHFMEKIHRIQKELTTQLGKAQAAYKKYHDRKTTKPPAFQVGDMVWLNRRNIATNRPSQKLDVKRLGPFCITESIGPHNLAYRLDLPPSMKIHPVFHVSLLEPHRQNTLPGRNLPPPPPIEVDNQTEWHVAEVLDSKLRRRKLMYLVDWEGFSPSERTWEPATNLTNAADKVNEFHQRYPQKPGPRGLQT
jgi:hypothetical protein